MSETTITTDGDRPIRPWLDAEEVAPFLCTTPHTLRRLAREGRCPVLVRRIGGRWRFSRLDLERFVSGDHDGNAA
jgi:predicted site-specific integrase-resolvase